MKLLKRPIQTYDENLLNYISQKYDLPQNIVTLLFSRGLDTDAKLDKFFNPTVDDFSDPYLFKDMKAVVEKVKNAISENQKIVILGDYDTDGISASAIMYKYFESINYPVDVFLPNRYIDGYGVTNDTIDKIIEMYNPNLIITVDCGISSVDEIAYCKSRGVDIIVTDHHETPDILPDTLIINPKIKNQDYPFTELCGAGVAFKFVQAIAGIDEAVKYLTIAAIATVADIVPLVDENRSIVSLGLTQQLNNLPKGLKMLCDRTSITLPMSSQDIAFKLAPKINASGRMGDATLSYMLYIEDDTKKLNNHIDKLMSINDKRISLTNDIFADAIAKLNDINVTNLGAIVLYDQNWEGGVLGIICSKLVDLYGKPVCLLSKVDGEYKGSCRSVAGINIHDALTAVSDLLIRFGGHNQAGGLSIKEENLDIFAERLNDYILAHKCDTDDTKYYDIDLDFTPSIDYLEKLNTLAPFGCANEKPVFRIKLDNVNANRLTNYYKYFKFKADNIEYMAFGLPNMFYNINANCEKQAIVDLNLESYKKVTKVKGTLKNLYYGKLTSIKNREIVSANYLLQLSKSGQNTPNILTTLNIPTLAETLTNKGEYNTIFVANTFETYKKYVDNIAVKNFELYYLNSLNGQNAIILAPDPNIDFKDYENVVFLDTPMSDDYLKSLKCKNIYIPNKNYNFNAYTMLDTSRKTFAICHNAIKNTLSNNADFEELYELYLTTKKDNPQIKNINYTQFVFAYMVMTELGILSQKDGVYCYNQIEKTSLENSKIYNMISVIAK